MDTLDSDLQKQLEQEEEEMWPPIRLDQDYSNIIVICGLPCVNREQEARFVPLIRGIITKVSVESTKEPVQITDFYMPYKSSPEESKGYVFVEFQKASHAMAAKQKMNGAKFVGKSYFKVYRYEEWACLDDIPDEYVPLTEKPYTPTDALQSWLYSDESLEGKDQYVIRYDSTSEVYWRGNGTVNMEIKKACNDNVDWSPCGTYLVNFAPLGVVLVGGPGWTQQRAFKHSHVEFVQFSPCEQYLFTWSLKLSANESQDNPQSIILWEIKTGKKLRAFPTIFDSDGARTSPKWHFKWSSDDKYFSRVVKGLIYVYGTDGVSLMPDETGAKKPVRLHGPVFDHAWSPTDPYMAAFVPEHNNIPARVMMMSMPSRKVISQQSIVNVKGCFIHWQEPAGNFLAVKVDRHGKSKKQNFTSFEFFRVREKDVPVEGLELKDVVLAFAWEPAGHRFAIIHAEAGSSSRTNVSFYSMAGGKLKLLKTLEKRQANHLYWAPTGRYIVIAGLRTMNHQLEFFDVDSLDTLAAVQHNQCTDITWDPTGCYLTTYVSHYRCKSENGFKLWTYRGVEQLSSNKEAFFQFLWRPRPPTLLPPEKIKWLETPRNFQEFQRKYKEKDLVEEAALKAKIAAEREEKRKEYRKWLAKRRAQWKADSEWRRSLGIIDDDEEDFYIVEECVEEVLGEEVTVLP